MILATHALVGGAIMKLMSRHPIIGLIFAFASHFALDAVPHWDYPLASEQKNKKDPLQNTINLNKKFIGDAAKLGLDGIFGLIFSVILFSRLAYNEYTWVWITLGAISAMLPDFLQFVYFRIRREPLRTLQRFHLWVQRYSMARENNLNILGIISQVIVIVLVIIFAFK